MIRFSYQFDDRTPLVEVTLSPDSTVGEVLEAFQSFLIASGYVINGEIDVVNAEDKSSERTK